MSVARRERIQQIASIIRKALELKVPVNVIKAVKDLGGKITSNTTLDDKIEALIAKHGNSFEIQLSQNYPTIRQRFTIAHELGHLFLHMGYLIDLKKWNSMTDYTDSVFYRYGFSTEENEANGFAGEFLMPSELFREVADENLGDGVYNLGPIADHFNVSINAVRTRGRWLGMFRWD